MTEATYPYFRSPIKIEHNYINAKPPVFTWVGCSIALGTLAYYAPKTFLGASSLLVGYQIHRFNKLVQTADKSKHREIQVWTINACQVIWSVGFVLGLQSIPWLASSVKAAKHFHLFRSGAHFIIGAFLGALGWGGFSAFDHTSKALAKQQRWVQMENYVENYPPEIKNHISSSYGKKIAFFIGALLPQTDLVRVLSKRTVAFCQFGSLQDKFQGLRNYFTRCASIPPSQNKEWGIAIHHFQELPFENQLQLGPQLAQIVNASSQKQERDALPNDLKLILFNERLKTFTKIPASTDEHYASWRNAVFQLRQYEEEKLEVFGAQLLRIIQASAPQEISYLNDNLKAAALKHCLQLLQYAPTLTPENLSTASELMMGLPPEKHKKFGPDVARFTANFSQDQIDRLSVTMNLALLHYHLTQSHMVPTADAERFSIWKMIGATYENLPTNTKLNTDLTTELTRIARVSAQENIDLLSPSLKERLTRLKRFTS